MRTSAILRLALERRNYRLFVAGRLVSLVGTWTQSVAQSWLVYRLTGSAFWLGVATFCQQAPTFLFASLGGLVADRHRRRTILVVTQSSAMVLAFALAILTLSGHVGVAQVLVLAVLLGAVNAVDSSTRQAFVSEMVGRENLASAVALNTTMVMGASFIGPAIAGVAITALGEGWCFLANGASFLAVIAGLLAMRDLPPTPKDPAQARTLWLAIAILIPLGMASIVQLTATNTLIQAMTPDALRGRVMAIWFMVLMGFAPVGSVIAGSITTASGPCLVLAVGGAVCALGAIGFARWSWTRRPVERRACAVRPRGAASGRRVARMTPSATVTGG